VIIPQYEALWLRLHEQSETESARSPAASSARFDIEQAFSHYASQSLPEAFSLVAGFTTTSTWERVFDRFPGLQVVLPRPIIGAMLSRAESREVFWREGLSWTEEAAIGWLVKHGFASVHVATPDSSVKTPEAMKT
jgi:hypothetical protein